MMMWNWKRSPELVAAEQAYSEAEMAQLKLICERHRMDKREYRRQLSAAWLRSVDALEVLTALRGAEVAARLHSAAEGAS